LSCRRLEYLIGEAKILALERREQRMVGLIEFYPDLFVPRMSPVADSEQVLEFVPVGVAADRVVISGYSPAVRDPVQQAPAQQFLDRILIGSVGLELVHILFGRSDPGAVAVVEDYRIEALEILRQVHRHVVADDRLERPGHLAQQLHGVLGLRDAVALVRTFIHKGRVPDQHAPRFLWCNTRLLRNCVGDSFSLPACQLPDDDCRRCDN